MKLYLYDIDYNNEIDFEDGNVLSVECESGEYFSQLVMNCKGINQDNLAVYDKEERIFFEKDAIVLIDYFAMQSHEKTLLTKLYKLLEQVNRDEEYVIERLRTIVKAFEEIANYSVDLYNVDLEINPSNNLADYYKFFDLNFCRETKDVCQNLIDFIDLLSMLKVYKILVLVNVKSFFSYNQVEEIIKRCAYSNQKTLLIDNVYTKDKHNNEIKLLIDRDFYDIMLK